MNEAWLNLQKATELAKFECVYGEFALDMSESSFELAETLYLLSEYRPRLDYKYFDYQKEDAARKQKHKLEDPDFHDDQDLNILTSEEKLIQQEKASV